MHGKELLNLESREDWREWLVLHHAEASEAWLVIYKKGVRGGAITLDEAVREALCFGWIDGTLRSVDKERYSLRFSPRKANSVWSMSNIERVQELTEAGLMTPAGLAKVEEGQASGQWRAAIRREETDRIPQDLERALRRKRGALAAYRDLNASQKKQYLHWIFSAKRPETRQRRIQSIVEEVRE